MKIDIDIVVTMIDRMILSTDYLRLDDVSNCITPSEAYIQALEEMRSELKDEYDSWAEAELEALSDQN